MLRRQREIERGGLVAENWASHKYREEGSQRLSWVGLRLLIGWLIDQVSWVGWSDNRAPRLVNWEGELTAGLGPRA